MVAVPVALKGDNLIVYFALAAFYHDPALKVRRIFLSDIRWLIYQNDHSDNNNKIKEAMEYLIENGYIYCESNSKYWDLDVEHSFKNVTKEQYVLVAPEEFTAICHSDMKNRFILFQIFVAILSTVDARVRYGKWSRESIAQRAGVNVKTLEHAFTILSDMQLIYFKNSVYDHVANQCLTSTYGRYIDRDLIRHIAAVRKLDTINNGDYN